ncbi:MAG TPA: flagellar filament outer layer protein FlaA, partial [Spirochaetia bacterium]|nr:flagellar filament outer layer protein FlaA [Spirochaetia bacterium]
QKIDLWIWGSNYNYWLDLYLRDYQGIDHVLHFGSLRFVGWKDLTVDIPSSIPQSRTYIPRYEGMVMTKLVMWTAPDEKVDDFFLFVDEINCLTDIFESRFDGEDLADPTYLNNLWQQGTK